MFDELHDPNPPAATSRHLAEVAERAAGLRRRRNAVAGGLGVATLLVAGTVGVAAVDRGGASVQTADAPLPSVAVAVEEDSAPTTTVLDPASLPPAVPVNPDPEDLPPATPVNPDADSGSAADSDGSESGADAPGSDDDSADTSGNGGAAGSDDVGDDTDSAGDTGLDVATAAALRADDPIVAISTSRDAVWFASLGPDAEPQVVTSGADRLDFLADGTAVVNIGSQVRLVDPAGGLIDEFVVGAVATANPAGNAVAGIDGGSAIVVQPVDADGASGDGLVYPLDLPGNTAVDLMWTSGESIIVLVRDGASWSLTFVETTGADPAQATRTVELSDLVANDLRFAGRTVAGELVLHEAGTASAYTVLPATPAAAAPLGLDAPARSVWFDGAELIAVGLDGTLTDTLDATLDATSDATSSGDDLGNAATIPGTYLSARR